MCVQNVNFLLKMKSKYLHKFFGCKMGLPSGEMSRREIEEASRSQEMKDLSLSMLQLETESI